MAWTELKTFRPQCDACRQLGPIIHVHICPEESDLPKGWEIRTLHDCGMTGYSRHDIYCGICVSLQDKKPMDR